MSDSRQVVPEPIVIDDDEYDTFIDQEDINEDKINSNEQLALDEDEAIDKSNIMSGRTRHAKPQASTRYSELNEDDIPESE